MNEVKRYDPVADTQELYDLQEDLVSGSDFDRVTAERDALQQDLNQRDEQIATLDLQREAHLRNSQVVERRVAVLEGLLANAYETAAKWVEKRCDDYVEEHGSRDPETGTVEFPGDGEEYVGELMEIAEGLRVLKPAEGRNPSTCTWKFGAFSWHTACGQEWMLNDGTPGQNGMHFCHSCGDRLLVEDKGDE